MRTITHFLARKGVASTSAAFAVPTPAKPGSPTAEEPSEPTLADIGARVGEENETLRNLLIDTAQWPGPERGQPDSRRSCQQRR
jgi:hypothetical protein